MFIDEVPHALGEIDARSPIRDLGVAPWSIHVDEHEDVSGVHRKNRAGTCLRSRAFVVSLRECYMYRLVRIQLEKFGFLDCGCSKGGSLQFGEDKLGGKNGLGIDIDPSKLQATRDAGYDAMSANLADSTQFEGAVDFTLMSHFLEHLPSVEIATKCVETALKVSERFIFVRQPWFDSDGSLFEHGLKLYWSDWKSHPNRLSSLQCYQMFSPYFESGELARFIIAGAHRILDSNHYAIHPFTAPTAQHGYDEARHGHKDHYAFPFKVYKEIVIVATKSLDDDPISLAKKIGKIEIVFDSKG